MEITFNSVPFLKCESRLPKLHLCLEPRVGEAAVSIGSKRGVLSEAAYFCESCAESKVSGGSKKHWCHRAASESAPVFHC
jgi:hypothetical protein